MPRADEIVSSSSGAVPAAPDPDPEPEPEPELEAELELKVDAGSDTSLGNGRPAMEKSSVEGSSGSMG